MKTEKAKGRLCYCLIVFLAACVAVPFYLFTEAVVNISEALKKVRGCENQ